MNGKVEGGWTLLATIFTVVFVAITIAGTLWVMFHMNANMMPDHPTMPGMPPAGADLRSSP
ncbi:Cytochrome bo(3) ubiquinol oxidase subunit 4 [compost metagenome]